MDNLISAILPSAVSLAVIGYFLRKQLEELTQLRRDFQTHLIEDAAMRERVNQLDSTINHKLDDIRDQL